MKCWFYGEIVKIQNVGQSQFFLFHPLFTSVYMDEARNSLFNFYVRDDTRMGQPRQNRSGEMLFIEELQKSEMRRKKERNSRLNDGKLLVFKSNGK